MKSSELAKARYAANSLEELRKMAKKFGFHELWAEKVWAARVEKSKNK